MVQFVKVGFPTKHPPLSTDGRLNLWSLLQLTMRLHEAKKRAELKIHRASAF